MGGKASREKGKRGERELSRVLSALVGLDCHRGQQYSGERGNPDVVGWVGVHVECKRVERLNLAQSMAQSRADCRPGDVPVVCHRTSRQPWMITLDLDQLPALCRRITQGGGCDIQRKSTGGN